MKTRIVHVVLFSLLLLGFSGHMNPTQAYLITFNEDLLSLYAYAHSYDLDAQGNVVNEQFAESFTAPEVEASVRGVDFYMTRFYSLNPYPYSFRVGYGIGNERHDNPSVVEWGGSIDNIYSFSILSDYGSSGYVDVDLMADYGRRGEPWSYTGTWGDRYNGYYPQDLTIKESNGNIVYSLGTDSMFHTYVSLCLGEQYTMEFTVNTQNPPGYDGQYYIWMQTASTETPPVPEPATMILLGTGLLGLIGLRKKMKQ